MKTIQLRLDDEARWLDHWLPPTKGGPAGREHPTAPHGVCVALTLQEQGSRSRRLFGSVLLGVVVLGATACPPNNKSRTWNTPPLS